MSNNVPMTPSSSFFRSVQAFGLLATAALLVDPVRMAVAGQILAAWQFLGLDSTDSRLHLASLIATMAINVWELGLVLGSYFVCPRRCRMRFCNWLAFFGVVLIFAGLIVSIMQLKALGYSLMASSHVSRSAFENWRVTRKLR